MESFRKYANMSRIGEVRPKLRKSDFKIHRPQTLFEPDWSTALSQGRCPWCGNKLREMRKVFLSCRGVKHKKPFVIRKERAEEIIRGKK